MAYDINTQPAIISILG